MMKTLFWNIRGINKKIAISRLKSLKKQHNLKLIGICEPRVEASRISEIQLKLGYQNHLSNNENRIWIFFDESLSGKIIGQSDQFLAIQFNHHFFSMDPVCIFVHAHCSNDFRRVLWEDLSLILNTYKNCILYGDFNVVVSAEEKRGGNPFVVSESLDFINFISDNSLLDIGFSGSQYTWCNNRSPRERIWKRLDRILVDSS